MYPHSERWLWAGRCRDCKRFRERPLPCHATGKLHRRNHGRTKAKLPRIIKDGFDGSLEARHLGLRGPEAPVQRFRP